MSKYELPDELINIILEYVFGECDHCLKKIYFKNLHKKVIIYKYKSIFDDDYYLPKESFHFNLICNHCLKTYFIDNTKFIYALINQKN